MSEVPVEMLPPEHPHSIPEDQDRRSPDTIYDLLVIGAGPTGLACAIEAQRAGLRAVSVDKGCVCNSLFHYPSHMTFFTTSELLEIGDIPFPSPNAKPSRNEALEYYRQVAAFYKLDIRQYHLVERVEGSDGAFTVHTVDRFGRPGTLKTRKLAIATGYYDLPNYLRHSRRRPEQSAPLLRRSSPLFRDGRAGHRRQELGGHRGTRIVAPRGAGHAGAPRSGIHRHVKYWIKPDIENRIKNSEIKAFSIPMWLKSRPRQWSSTRPPAAKPCATISSSP